MRASLGREELDAEFKAVYPISQRLATLSRESDVRELLLRSARHVAGLDGAAVVMTDEHDTRYVVEAATGWPADYLKREVALDERTWAAWVLRSAEEAYLLDHVAGHENPMPILVLDEGAGRDGVSPRRAASRPQPHARRARPHRAARCLRRLGAARPRDPRQPGGGDDPAHQGPRAAAPARRARRAHRSLQPARVQRAARLGDRERGPPRGRAARPRAPRHRPLQEAQRHVRPPRGGRRPASRWRASSSSTSARATTPPATAARSSW